MYIHCIEDLNIYMKDFLNHIDCERLWDSCGAWHPNHLNKYFIQLDQTAAAEMSSVIQLKPQNAFPDIKNYVTIMRYAVIAEHELAMNWVKSIKGTCFQLQAIAVSGADNQHYIVLIDCDQTILLRFDPDEQLKINFTSSIDDCEEDWSVMVVEQLSFTAQEQTSIILY